MKARRAIRTRTRRVIARAAATTSALAFLGGTPEASATALNNWTPDAEGVHWLIAWESSDPDDPQRRLHVCTERVGIHLYVKIGDNQYTDFEGCFTLPPQAVCGGSGPLVGIYDRKYNAVVRMSFDACPVPAHGMQYIVGAGSFANTGWKSV